jgi:hypothetical protein
MTPTSTVSTVTTSVTLLVAAIAAGAALLGAIVGGAAQLVVLWLNRRHALDDARRARKLDLYSRLLHLVWGFPNLMDQALPKGPPESYRIQAEFVEASDRLSVELLLHGTEDVRVAAEAVRKAVWASFEHWKRLSEEDLAKERSDRRGVAVTMREAWEHGVWPALRSLSDIMASELRSR